MSSPGGAAAAAAAAAGSPAVLVKVGDGGVWGVFEHDDDVLDMHCTARSC
jgi:hypothetical protein